MQSTLSFLLVFLVVSTAAFAQESLQGDWVGVVQIEKNSSPLRWHIENHNGSVTMPVVRLFEEPFTDFEAKDKAFKIALQKEKQTITFSGTQNGNSLSGDYNDGITKGEFQMQRLAQVTAEKYFGTYENAKGNHIYIRTWDELGPDQLTYFDGDGRIGALLPESTTSFTSGPGIWIPLPTSVRAEFVLNASGEAIAVMWTENGSPSKQFEKLNIHDEKEISVTNGNVTLAGSLVVPRRGGPHPAVVLVHGSGPVTRDFFGPIAYLLAKHGFAVFSYDKRGNGKSGGDWLEADFEDLAADAIAAVAMLKSRPEIDAKKIGLLGISQGGWIVPLAISKSSDIAFAILISTPSVSPAQQEIQRVEEEMKVQGATADQIKTQVAQLSADLDSLRKEETVQALQSEIEKLKSAGNERLLKANGSENPRFLLFYHRIMDFDPLPILQKMRCPVLVLYGEADRGVPVKGNLDKLVNVLKQTEGARYTVRVFPKGNHALLLSETGSYEEFFHLNRFVPDFFSTLTDWMRNLLNHRHH